MRLSLRFNLPALLVLLASFILLLLGYGMHPPFTKWGMILPGVYLVLRLVLRKARRGRAARRRAALKGGVPGQKT